MLENVCEALVFQVHPQGFSLQQWAKLESFFFYFDFADNELLFKHKKV